MRPVKVCWWLALAFFGCDHRPDPIAPFPDVGTVHVPGAVDMRVPDMPIPSPAPDLSVVVDLGPPPDGGADDGGAATNDAAANDAGMGDLGPGTPPVDPNVLQLVVSVEWQGASLQESDLAALESLRTQQPDVPLTHFLNAAYYTKSDAMEAEVTAQLKRPVRPIDELGLELSGWQRLVEAAGVPFRAMPTFWGRPLTNCSYDCGAEVDISAYTEAELETLLQFSIDKLDKEGFGRATSFRAAGWLGKDNVVEAAQAKGVTRDSSAVDAEFFDNSPQRSAPLFTWLHALWKDITRSSQPYSRTTAKGMVVEIPDNGSRADYLSASEMVGVYRACRDYKKANPTKHVALHLALQQEGAGQYASRVTDALTQIFNLAKQDGITVKAVTVKALETSL